MDSIPFLSLGLGTLLGTAVLTLRPRSSNRMTAIGAVCFALLCFAGAATEVLGHSHAHFEDPWVKSLRADVLTVLPIVFYTALTLVSLILAPKRDTTGAAPAGMLLLATGTVTAYCAASLPLLAAGWWITAVPFVLNLFGPSPARGIHSLFLCTSAVLVTAFCIHSNSLESFSGTGSVAFLLVIAAVVVRKGLFPLHSWVVTSFEHGPLIPAVLLFNGHLGALLTARTEAVKLPGFAHSALDWLSIAALLTDLISSFRGFAEKTPRRLLAFVCISQASFILAGLATCNRQGITGALLHWFVVAVASTLLASILRILEVRVLDVANPSGHLGLAIRAPRLATFFLIGALALIGLPGTLGYNAEDLLFHGALQSHPWLGICLLAATAFNAINLLRLHSTLFLGVLPKHVLHIADALPRERWPAVACVVALVAGGLLSSRVLPFISGVSDGLHPTPPQHATDSFGN
jgi:NADH:ubiquinone oxidoreductase subunit 2 (subunit N)